MKPILSLALIGGGLFAFYKMRQYADSKFESSGNTTPPSNSPQGSFAPGEPAPSASAAPTPVTKVETLFTPKPVVIAKDPVLKPSEVAPKPADPVVVKASDMIDISKAPKVIQSSVTKTEALFTPGPTPVVKPADPIVVKASDMINISSVKKPATKTEVLFTAPASKKPEESIAKPKTTSQKEKSMLSGLRY